MQGADYEGARLRALEALSAHRASRSTMPVEIEERLKGLYLRTRRYDDLVASIDSGLGHLVVKMKDGTRHEGRGLAILGGSGSGKSRSIRRALSHHPLFPGFAKGDPNCLAISVHCKGSYTLKVLGVEISKALGYPLALTLDENVVWERVRAKIAEKAIVLLHIDEINSLLRKASSPERDRIVDQFKSLQNDKDWPVFLILSGTPRSRDYLTMRDPDGELERRMTWQTYDKLDAHKDRKKIWLHLKELCGIAEVELGASVDEEIVSRLMHAARYELGYAAEIAVQAIICAWESQTALGIEHFARVVSRTCSFDKNPFETDRWWETKVMSRSEDDDDDAFSRTPARRRLGRKRR